MKYKFNLKMYRTVASNITKFMKIKKVSLEDLCTNAEIKAQFLAKFLQKDSNLKIAIYDLYKISIVLDVNINEFFK